MALQEEIEKRAKEIHTDGYPMSIGELMSLYRDSEIDIHPEFQRVFRWSPIQKSKLIESILLGIPIPSVFISQREDGVWDVIDGLQRLSTIFEFVGMLRDENGALIVAEPLVATEYLPSLKGKFWEKSEDEANSFNPTQRLLFKRAKLDMRIIKKESDPNAKYELFQRLNTGGTRLTDQEVRNCILIMLNRELYRWLDGLSKDSSFRECISLSEKQEQESYHMELVVRLIICKNATQDELQEIYDLDEFLTEKIKAIAQGGAFDRTEEEASFIGTFSLLHDSLGEESFRRYDSNKDRFLGPFLISAFEVIAIGLASSYVKWQSLNSTVAKEKIIEKVKQLYENAEYRSNSGAGVNPRRRLTTLVKLGKTIFVP